MTATMGFPWSDQETLVLTMAWRAGCTADEIAQSLRAFGRHRSKRAVLKKVKQLGLPARRRQLKTAEAA
jgi:hypothetical protein